MVKKIDLMMKTITIQEALLLKDEEVVFIDTRSPIEFEKDNIPGSLNIPLFSNEERAIVGTLYGQDKEKAYQTGFGIYNETPILGLPGNPAAVFVTFLMLGIPILKLMSGRKLLKNSYIPVKINFEHKKKLGRKEFLRVQLKSKGNSLILKYKRLR